MEYYSKKSFKALVYNFINYCQFIGELYFIVLQYFVINYIIYIFSIPNATYVILLGKILSLVNNIMSY